MSSGLLHFPIPTSSAFPQHLEFHLFSLISTVGKPLVCHSDTLQTFPDENSYVGGLGATSQGMRSMQKAQGILASSRHGLYSDINKVQVRCSNDRPVCKRCARLRHNCVYATEGIRATAVSQSNKLVQEVGSVSTATRASNPQKSGDRNYITPEAIEPLIRSVPRPPLPEKTLLGIPDSLVAALVDVYYSHVYNASLLVHRASFLQALKTGIADPAMVLSICAFASMYGQ